MIETFGKNEQVKKVFRVLVVAVAGLVITKVLTPAFTILHSQSFPGVGMMW
jgi:hypothetical protein